MPAAAQTDKNASEGQMNPVLMEAALLVKQDVIAYEDAVAFVTQNVAFHIRSLIRRLRKNYYGVFDEPYDPHTNRQKIWVPLTEVTVENVVKNYDLDQKDGNVRAKNPKGYEATEVIRARLTEEFDKMFFGEKLDELERVTNIDGTGIWKIMKAPKKSKRLFDIRLVDRLNFYIDTNAHSIQEAYSVVERAVLTPQMVDGMDWDNKKDVTYFKETPQVDRQMMGRANLAATAEYAEIYERWGTIPSYLIPNKYGEKDSEENKKAPKNIEGQIVVANLFKNPVVLLIKENPDGLKPYEENWCTRVPNRWDGKGTAEKVLMLNLWINTVVNIRINRNYLAQLGVMKVKQGSGITSQMLQRLASTGTISVKNMEDISQLVVQEAGPGSYTDEAAIKNWAKEVTSTYESATGEALPASTPATNAVLQSRASQSEFQMMREGLGMFLQRVADRHMLPHIFDDVDEGDLIRLSADYEGFAGVIDRIAAYYVYAEYEKFTVRNIIPTPEEVQSAIEAARTKLMLNKDLFINILQKYTKDMCDTKFYVTNEEMDTGVMIDKLTNMLKIAPEYRDFTIAQVYDLMGLARPHKNFQPQPTPAGGAPVPGGAVPSPIQNPGTTPSTPQQVLASNSQ